MCRVVSCRVVLCCVCYRIGIELLKLAVELIVTVLRDALEDVPDRQRTAHNTAQRNSAQHSTASAAGVKVADPAQRSTAQRNKRQRKTRQRNKRVHIHILQQPRVILQRRIL